MHNEVIGGARGLAACHPRPGSNVYLCHAELQQLRQLRLHWQLLPPGWFRTVRLQIIDTLLNVDVPHVVHDFVFTLRVSRRIGWFEYVPPFVLPHDFSSSRQCHLAAPMHAASVNLTQSHFRL